MANEKMKLFFRGGGRHKNFHETFPKYGSFSFIDDGVYDVPAEVGLHLIDEFPQLFGKTAKSVSKSRGETTIPAKVKKQSRKELLAFNEERAKEIAEKADADSLKRKEEQAAEDARLEKQAKEKLKREADIKQEEKDQAEKDREAEERKKKEEAKLKAEKDQADKLAAKEQEEKDQAEKDKEGAPSNVTTT